MINFKYGKCTEQNKNAILEIWNEEYCDGHFLKTLEINDLNNIINNISFSWDHTVSVSVDEQLVGYLFYYDNIIAFCRESVNPLQKICPSKRAEKLKRGC